jgi:hypothetical protein
MPETAQSPARHHPHPSTRSSTMRRGLQPRATAACAPPPMPASYESSVLTRHGFSPGHLMWFPDWIKGHPPKPGRCHRLSQCLVTFCVRHVESRPLFSSAPSPLAPSARSGNRSRESLRGRISAFTPCPTSDFRSAGARPGLPSPQARPAASTPSPAPSRSEQHLAFSCSRSLRWES